MQSSSRVTARLIAIVSFGLISFSSPIMPIVASIRSLSTEILSSNFNLALSTLFVSAARMGNASFP